MSGPAVKIELFKCENDALLVDIVADTSDHALTPGQKEILTRIPALYGAPEDRPIYRDLTTVHGDTHTEIDAQKIREMMEDINPLIDEANLPHQIAQILMEHGYPVELNPDPRPIEQRGEYFFNLN